MERGRGEIKTGGRRVVEIGRDMKRGETNKERREGEKNTEEKR
jgi:hypothetical protein